jgi:Family of unknown function (DUF6516)
MSDPFRTAQDYESFLYTLREQFPIIRGSTVVLVRRGAGLGRVTGERQFEHGFRLVVRERLLLDREPLSIDGSAYEAWRDQERLFWYDPQPHTDEPALRSSFPHHKRVPPDIKHHRVPAPQLSFMHPNLPGLIAEIADLIGDKP